MATTVLRTRVNRARAHKAGKIFERIGLKQDVAFDLFLAKVVAVRGLPFPVGESDDGHLPHIPNARTVAALKERGIGFSVHWRPLHLHPYYQKRFGWSSEQLPHATREWERRFSVPLFPGMTDAEQDRVVEAIQELCRQNRRRSEWRGAHGAADVESAPAIACAGAPSVARSAAVEEGL